MNVSEIMTKNVVAVKEDDLVTKVRAIMRDKGFRAVPVIDKNNKMVGIIGRGDVLQITASKSNLLVKGLMRRHVVTGFEDEDIKIVAKRMIDYGIKQIVIVDKKDKNKFLGIVSALDILSAFVKEEYVPKIDIVSKIMKKETITCSEEDEVTRIKEEMRTSDLTGMPVVRKEGKNKKRLVGFVTIGDLIKSTVSQESGKPKKMKIKDVMKALVKYVDVNERVSEVAKLMVKNRILRVPVVDNKENKNLEGIVDIEDMLGAYL